MVEALYEEIKKSSFKAAKNTGKVRHLLQIRSSKVRVNVYLITILFQGKICIKELEFREVGDRETNLLSEIFGSSRWNF